MKPTRVLVAVAEPQQSKYIERILTSGGDGIDIVGTASDGHEAVTLTEQLQPSVVIMGIELPMMNGFAATKEIMIRRPTPVLILAGNVKGLCSMENERAYRCGAVSFLPGMAGAGAELQLLEAVRKAAASRVTRYWRILQPWATSAEIQAVAVFLSSRAAEALAQMLSALPDDFAAPVLVVSYVGGGFADGFAAWLGRNCSLRVKVAEQGEVLTAGTVYIAPVGRHLEVAEDAVPVVRLSDAPPLGGYRPSGIHLLSTLAKVYGPKGLVFVMEGVREELISAMCAIWLEGGRVFAQQRRPGESLRWPPEKILLELADAVMDPATLGPWLTQTTAARESDRSAGSAASTREGIEGRHSAGSAPAQGAH